MRFSRARQPRSSESCTKLTSLFLLLITPCLIPAPCEAGAWTQPEGKLQGILTANYYTTNRYRDNSGNKLSQPRFSKYEINPYVEYGWRDDLTIGANAFLHYVTQRNATRDDNFGLADTELFARYRFYNDGRYVLSVQPLIKLPSLYESNALPRGGNRHWDGELSLQGGMSFKGFGRNHFAELDAGYRYRAGSPEDQFRAGLTIGLSICDRWTLLPQVFGTWRMDKKPAAIFSQSGDSDYNLVKGQLSALYKLDETVDVQFGAYSHLYARNTGTGGGVTVAVWKRF